MNFTTIAKSPLFKGFSEADFSIFLEKGIILEKNLEIGEYLFHYGQIIDEICVVKKGLIQIELNDFWGSRTVFDNVASGEVFAETYAVTKEPLIVEVKAIEKTEILMISMEKLSKDLNSHINDLQTKFFTNLMKISFNKNLNLSRKIMHTSFKTVRGRLISFLSYQAGKNCSNEFEIPFDRQTLADYLNVDRSAMSKELGKMVQEGLLETKKNHFLLKKPLEL